MHSLEGWRPETLEAARELLEGLGVETVEIDVRRLRLLALSLVEEHGWSPRRMVDLMHVLAAVGLGCHGLVAVDRFIRRRAKEYGLLYLNHLTGCP